MQVFRIFKIKMERRMMMRVGVISRRNNSLITADLKVIFFTRAVSLKGGEKFSKQLSNRLFDTINKTLIIQK